MNDHERLHAIVTGRVQGVNYRYNTELRAGALGLRGWVANRPDGTVEVVAEGPRAALNDLLAFLHAGPAMARVEQVETRWLLATGEFNDFRTRYR